MATIEIPNEEDYQRIIQVADTFGIEYSLGKLEQIAELSREGWIVVPQEEENFKSISGYSFEVDSSRLSYSSASEKVGKELGINYQNTSKDSLGRDFVGNNNWEESLRLVQSLGVKATNLKEEFDYLHLIYLGSQNKIKVYDVSGKRVDSKLCEKLLMDSIKVQAPWRGNWIDADYKVEKNGLKVHSNHLFDKEGNITDFKSEVLDGNTLREDKQIDVIDYLTKNHTSQGHVSVKVKSGSFYFWSPGKDNNSVARFDAGSYWAVLVCNGYPQGRYANLGVRAAKLRG